MTKFNADINNAREGWVQVTISGDNAHLLTEEQIASSLSTLPIAGEGKELTEFQAGQWWLEELEKHWGTGETSHQTRRAAKVALSFAEAYFGPYSPGKDGGQEVEAVANLWDGPIEELSRAKAGRFYDVANEHPKCALGEREAYINKNWQNWREDAAIEVADLSPPASTALVEWQPIDSAPRDGSPVLIWVDGHVIEACFDSEAYEWVAGVWGLGFDEDASYWRPLPSPPAQHAFSIHEEGLSRHD